MIFPEKFVSGQTIESALYLDKYPAGEWQLTVIALSVSGNEALNVEAAADDTAHYLLIDTSGLAAGKYAYQAKVDNGAETYFVERGRFEVEANLFSQIGSTGDVLSLDTRSHAEKMLASIEALLEGRATSEHKIIKHNNRELQKHSFSELIEIRDYYRGEMSRANAKKRGSFKNIGVRF